MARSAKTRWPYIAGIVVLSAALVGIARVLPRFFSRPAPQVVTASGRIEGRDVTLAPKDIQGRVKRLLVDEGQTVSKGQLLAELDAAQLEAKYATVSAGIANLDVQINQATLDVSYTAKNSAASIAAAEAAVSGAKARLVRAQAVLANSKSAQERAARLLDAGAIAQQELDQADMGLRTSEADVAAAEKDIARVEADLNLARASKDTIALKRQQVRALQATRQAALGQLAEAQANLAERQIVAPTAGTILSRPVEVGDVVSPGSPVFVMVDMSRLYLKVYVPEPDIPKIRLGDPAEVRVDAFPHRVFAARVSKISDQAEFTPKNVETADERLKLVFGVELSFVDPDHVLKPGMPADGVIHWANGSDGTGHGS
jgi:HlyD family secretion protein